MAGPYPQNETWRMYFDYVTGNSPGVSKQHTMLWRFRPEADIADVIADGQNRMAAMLTAFTAPQFRLGWRITGCRLSAPLTDISLPVDLSTALMTFQGSTSGGDWNSSKEAIQYRKEGRSYTTGVRTSFSIYGLSNEDIDTNFRWQVGELGVLAAVNATLSELGGEQLVARDGSAVTWYSYLNCQYNSYWERNIRG